MSLKAFHLIFITASLLLVLGFGVWALVAYAKVGGFFYLGSGIGSGLGGAALVVYGRYFLKKLRNISYL